MKKIKLEGKLNLNKETITKLNETEMKSVEGGGFLSIGRACSYKRKCELKGKVSVAIFCD